MLPKQILLCQSDDFSPYVFFSLCLYLPSAQHNLNQTNEEQEIPIKYLEFILHTFVTVLIISLIVCLYAMS